MQICKGRKTCNAHPHEDESHFQSCFGICDAVNRMSRWICDAAALANLHYTAECNLSCVTHKTPRFVLQNPHPDFGVGTFLLRIILAENFPGKRAREAGAGSAAAARPGGDRGKDGNREDDGADCILYKSTYRTRSNSCNLSCITNLFLKVNPNYKFYFSCWGNL